MNRASRFVATALLLVGSAMQTACGNSIGAESAGQSFDARKYWDRCLGTQCPPMDETDARKK